MNGTGTNGASGTIRDDLAAGFADRYFPEDRAQDQSTQRADAEQSRQRAEQVAGTYQSARESFTTCLALAVPLYLTEVSARDNGNLVLTASGQTTEYAVIEPWVWQKIGGDELIAADTDGEVRLSLNPAHILIPASTTTRMLMPMLVGGAAAIIVVLLVWPVGAVLRRRAVRADGPARPALPWTGRTAHIGALIAATVTPGWMGLWMIASQPSYRFLSSDLVMRGMQAAQWLGVLALVPALWDLVKAVRGRAGWRRITVSAILVAGLAALAWVAWSANLLTSGTRY